MRVEFADGQGGAVRDGAPMECLLCGTHDPVSHTMVRRPDGRGWAGRICGEHTLAEVQLRSFDRWDIEITLCERPVEAQQEYPLGPVPSFPGYMLCTVKGEDGEWCRGGHWTRDHVTAVAQAVRDGEVGR